MPRFKNKLKKKSLQVTYRFMNFEGRYPETLNVQEEVATGDETALKTFCFQRE